MTNETVAAVYKKLGLAMRPTHATFPDGGYNFEAGIQIMEERFAAKKLLVAAHLAEVFDEYAGYHRLNGKVVKIDDDLMSAIRVGCMDLRFAKTFRDFPAMRRAGAAGTQFARGTPNHPDGDMNVFDGT
jgi:hypothetical protein